ncbi:MAG TPA: hypothetical protein VLJ39_03085, partial [Tepidisphaeraceae bacterium]|nr:hypothetical protein [Tepidisphaeraceae bacterium]
MLWWTFQNLVTTGLLAGLVWLVCRVTRIGPVARHALWLVVLLKLLMPPMVAWPWRVPDPVARLMPQDLPRVVQVEARVNTVEPTPSLPDVVGETQVPFLPEIPSEPQVEGPPAPATVQTVAPPPAIPAPTPPIITPAPEPQHFLPVVPVAWLAIVLRWAGRVWVAGGICFALVHLARIVRMLRVRGRAMPAEAEQAG